MTKDLSDFIRKMDQVIEDMKTQRLHDSNHYETQLKKLQDRCTALEKKVALLKQEDELC